MNTIWEKYKRFKIVLSYICCLWLSMGYACSILDKILCFAENEIVDPSKIFFNQLFPFFFFFLSTDWHSNLINQKKKSKNYSQQKLDSICLGFNENRSICFLLRFFSFFNFIFKMVMKLVIVLNVNIEFIQKDLTTYINYIVLLFLFFAHHFCSRFFISFRFYTMVNCSVDM